MPKSEEPAEFESAPLWPGISLCIIVAIFSFITWLAFKPVSALMWALVYSIVIANLTKLPKKSWSGIDFCAKEFLKGVVASLGIVTSVSIWLEVGVGAINALTIVFFSFFFGLWLGRKFGLTSVLATLISVGTSICGASAIAAIGPAIGAKEEEIGLALACITIFGLVATLLYPFLYVNSVVGRWLGLNINVYSIWVGSGVHETAQVLAAAGALNSSAIGPALLVKSVRIFMIGPMILIATYVLSKTRDLKTKRVLPAFGLIFILNSFFCAILDAYHSQIFALGFDWLLTKTVLSGTVFPFLMTIALAGVGFKVRLRDIKGLGTRPLAVGALIAILAGILALIMATAVVPFVSRPE